MIPYKCKMCGGDLSVAAGRIVCECDFCGTRQTVPSAEHEKKANLFNRANRLRMNNEFDKAAAVYEQLAAEFPKEAEAYWGLCLCAYGIEYVDDPATGEKKPTCHRTLPASIIEDANFEQACENADTVARQFYRDEAKTIDRIQRSILLIAEREAPYDIFICYKETGESGERTEESVLAQEVYDRLTEKGMKVFFSRITLEDKLGEQYEPYIYAALSSARVMLAFGTSFEHYDAVWVKNEWSRFLAMQKADRRKVLIPCYKNLDAYDMPKEFRGLQAQDIGKLGWMQDLVRGIEKIIGQKTTTPSHGKTTDSDIQNMLRLGQQALQDGAWVEANHIFTDILYRDMNCGEAYLGKYLAARHVKKADDLKPLIVNIDPERPDKSPDILSDPLFIHALENKADGLQAKQDEWLKEREQQLKDFDRKKALYDQAYEELHHEEYAHAGELYGQLPGFLDSDERAKQCLQIAEFDKRLGSASGEQECNRIAEEFQQVFSGDKIVLGAFKQKCKIAAMRHHEKEEKLREEQEINKRLSTAAEEAKKARTAPACMDIIEKIQDLAQYPEGTEIIRECGRKSRLFCKSVCRRAKVKMFFRNYDQALNMLNDISWNEQARKLIAKCNEAKKKPDVIYTGATHALICIVCSAFFALLTVANINNYVEGLKQYSAGIALLGMPLLILLCWKRCKHKSTRHIFLAALVAFIAMFITSNKLMSDRNGSDFLHFLLSFVPFAIYFIF